mmetsp:Transcript_58475/g.155605  ORF Transcript_58475/g.155605 Transcript_58475/m.155605 type:complete len:242 (+) Transcript_58475:490-1215(+)
MLLKMLPETLAHAVHALVQYVQVLRLNLTHSALQILQPSLELWRQSLLNHCQLLFHARFKLRQRVVVLGTLHLDAQINKLCKLGSHVSVQRLDKRVDVPNFLTGLVQVIEVFNSFCCNRAPDLFDGASQRLHLSTKLMLHVGDCQGIIRTRQRPLHRRSPLLHQLLHPETLAGHSLAQLRHPLLHVSRVQLHRGELLLESRLEFGDLRPLRGTCQNFDAETQFRQVSRDTRHGLLHFATRI